MANETVTQKVSSVPEEIMFNSYEAFKKIKDLVLVDEYGAFRSLDSDQWNQLDNLASEGLALSSKNWGRLLSKVASFKGKEADIKPDLTTLVNEMEAAVNGSKAQFGVLLDSSESLKVSMERVLAELKHFSVPVEPVNPEAPDFTIVKKEKNVWVEALKATIGLRSRSFLTRFLVRYNQKFIRSQILFDKVMQLQADLESESDEAVVADKEAAINQLKAILLGVDTFQNERALISLFQEAVEAFEMELEDYHRSIYKKAKDGHDTPEFAQLLESFLEWLMEHVSNFAEVQVNIYFLKQLLYHQNNKAYAKRMGRIAAEAGDINREALSSFSAAMVLRVHALGVPLSGSKAELFDFPATYKFHRSIPDGRIAKTSELGDIDADKLIEIRGFVKAMETFRDSSNKLISRLIIEDSRGGALVATEAIFLQLRNEGIAPGAYCHIQANVRDSIEYEGSEIPRLLIDRLSIKTKLIPKSWKVAFLDLSYPYYERWPNGLNIKFSLSPHHPDSDSANHKLGAADLGFKPMVN